MAIWINTRCAACDEVFADVWSDEDYPHCCGQKTRWSPARLHTTEWGSPRHIPTLRDEPFGSRSELNAFTTKHGLYLGASNEKVHGARNESHLHLGKKYSYSGSPKS